jgi:serine/threonine protein kinase
MEIGRFRLGEKLGEGATGIVYRAAAAGAQVAVKVLRSDLDEVARARFLREARVAAESRHVVPILEVGEADGQTYLVMPFYERSLAALLREGPLELDKTARLAADLGRGLDALHERGILHRDVKPSNVLLGPDGAALADFGLARAADSTRLTREGQLLGTPLYLAPELIEGEEATRASDLYALGCVLYECLAGRPPFVGRGAAEIGFAHLVEKPDVAGLPSNVGLALLTALAKEPAARPTTGTALARLLHAARSARPS